MRVRARARVSASFRREVGWMNSGCASMCATIGSRNLERAKKYDDSATHSTGAPVGARPSTSSSSV